LSTKKETHVAVDCTRCEMRVRAKILSQYTDGQGGDWDCMTNYLFLECPSCKSVLLASRELEFDPMINDMDWGKVVRVWPEQENRLNSNLPSVVKKSLEEAGKCYKAKAFSACAVMCRRTLEGICVENGVKNKVLAAGLKELLNKKVIDEKIYKWSEELRIHGNIGAHAVAEDISMPDAKDLLEFTSAICDYVFILSDKFEKFMKRKMSTSKDASLKS